MTLVPFDIHKAIKVVLNEYERKYSKKLTGKELAEMIEISPSYARKLLARARAAK